MSTDNEDMLKNLSAATIRFTPVRVEHAAYIYSLRVDPILKRHLSGPPPSVESQAEWIRGYVEREAAGKEYYFVIERTDGTQCGTVRLYDFQYEGDKPASFCWGSWILDEHKTRFSAIESALLVYEIGFNRLGFPSSHFDVRKLNTKVIDFHRKFGAELTGEDEDNVYMRLPREAFELVKPKMMLLAERHAGHAPQETVFR